MLHISKLLFLLISPNQETILRTLGLENVLYRLHESDDYRKADFNYPDLTRDIEDIKTFAGRVTLNEKLEICKIILEGIWEKIYAGVSLNDIENIVFFVLFARFIIFAVNYNLKTSFYITCITLFAGYCWYRHLIDIVQLYRYAIVKLPFFGRFGENAKKFTSFRRGVVTDDLKLGEDVHWYNPGQLLYVAFNKAIKSRDPSTGNIYYIDPISVYISSLPVSKQMSILPMYYKIYNFLIPNIFSTLVQFWQQIAGLAAYVFITRIGKKYCPYLIRWHWTVLILITILEPFFINVVDRANSFKKSLFTVEGQTHFYSSYKIFFAASQDVKEHEATLNKIITTLDGAITWLIVAHLGFLIFALFHAVCGQYFYIPIVVENAELHIGPRPKDSIYSGGYTSWQDKEEKPQNSKRGFPKVWYGWFGRGTQKKIKSNDRLNKILKKIRRFLKK